MTIDDGRETAFPAMSYSTVLSAVWPCGVVNAQYTVHQPAVAVSVLRQGRWKRVVNDRGERNQRQLRTIPEPRPDPR